MNHNKSTTAEIWLLSLKLQMGQLSFRNNQFKFKTLGELSTILEGSMEYNMLHQ